MKNQLRLLGRSDFYWSGAIGPELKSQSELDQPIKNQSHNVLTANEIQTPLFHKV